MLWWIGVAIVLLVFLDLLFVELRRIRRELMRIQARVSGYGDLPIFARAAQAETDAERLNLALAEIDPLVERGRAAIARLRTAFGRPYQLSEFATLPIDEPKAR